MVPTWLRDEQFSAMSSSDMWCLGEDTRRGRMLEKRYEEVMKNDAMKVTVKSATKKTTTKKTTTKKTTTKKTTTKKTIKKEATKREGERALDDQKLQQRSSLYTPLIDGREEKVCITQTRQQFV